MDHYWIQSSSLTAYQTEVFKRLNATWILQPLFTNDSNCPSNHPEYCYDPTVANEQKASVKFKSSDIVFYVSSKATIKNIIFDGADLAFYDTSKLNCAQMADGMCCIEGSSGTVSANSSIADASKLIKCLIMSNNTTLI